MQAKALEIRDEGTFVAALAVDMNPDLADQNGPRRQTWLLRRCGYACDGRPNIILTHLAGTGEQATNDPYAWGLRRTFAVAHNYIIDNWATLKDGDVVDVEFILGETTAPKQSERVTP